jgi:hypothetical protein
MAVVMMAPGDGQCCHRKTSLADWLPEKKLPNGEVEARQVMKSDERRIREMPNKAKRVENYVQSRFLSMMLTPLMPITAGRGPAPRKNYVQSQFLRG